MPSQPGLQSPRERQLEVALRLWLEWSEAYDRLTERMFQARHDQARVEALADEIEAFRQRALAASREVLG